MFGLPYFVIFSLLYSPLTATSLALTIWALFWRGRLSDTDWAKKEASFARARIWALVPWALLVAIAPAISAHPPEAESGLLGLYFAWAGPPALAFALSFAPYFTWAIGRGRMPVHARRTLSSRTTLAFIWASCAAAEIGISLYAQIIAEPLGPAAMIFAFYLPAIWLWIVVVTILLHALAVRRTNRERLEAAPLAGG